MSFALALAVYLLMNQSMFGSPFAISLPWIPGSFVEGAWGLLFSPTYGHMIVAPALVAAFLAWPRFFRCFPRDAIVLAVGILMHFSLYASFGTWSGAVCYAARYVVPLLPLVFAPLVLLPETWLWQHRGARYGIIAICALSVVINGVAAMPYWAWWNTNPVLVAVQKIFGITLGG